MGKLIIKRIFSLTGKRISVPGESDKTPMNASQGSIFLQYLNTLFCWWTREAAFCGWKWASSLPSLFWEWTTGWHRTVKTGNVASAALNWHLRICIYLTHVLNYIPLGNLLAKTEKLRLLVIDTDTTHSSVLAWGIPGMGEPGGLPSVGSHRVGHDWSDLAAAAADSG